MFDNNMADELQSVFEENGPLARSIAGYSTRPQQQIMAESIAQALDKNETLIVEAGTGTGKTYAYLVPVLLAGTKVIISTGTKHLQDQLFHRDLPVVRDALGVSCRTALLKGRANYLCLHRLQLAQGEGWSASQKQVQELRRVQDWSGRTVSGDVVELSSIPEGSPVWPRVTSTPENCLGQECEFSDRCFVIKARRAAQQADLLVVNHHLLFADMVLKEEGFGELLPGADAIILDEAHQLPEVASHFFGIRFSSRQLLELVRDTKMEHVSEAGDMQDLPAAAGILEKAVLDTRLALGTETRSAAWNDVKHQASLQSSLTKLKESLTALTAWLEVAASRGKGLDGCWRRGLDLQQQLQLMTDEVPDEYIHWFETRSRAFTLHLTPLAVAHNFQDQMANMEGAWVFTSATLTVCDRFDHFAARLGLDKARTLCLDSPFDYKNNALLYLPKNLPEPNSDPFTRAVAELALQVIQASGGRAFLLFTSHRALNEAAEIIEADSEYPMLVQGSAPRSELLKRFRELGNAVLLGTNSFWEGVDVRGPALSCVLIDRLPFASPGEPVLQARIEALRSRGGNPFMEYQLPNAVIALKQGIGRLIRDQQDRGVLVLCDPRLLGKSYGKVFLDSLPAMFCSRDLDDVHMFFADESADGLQTKKG